MKRKSPKISITIPADLLKEVRQVAKSEQRSTSNAVAALIRRGIELDAANIAAEQKKTYGKKTK